MKVHALFTDYDGTIAPSHVKREDSRVPTRVAGKLKELSSVIPVGVITSKDYGFIRPRTNFARAWGSSGGIEITLADGSTRIPRNMPDLTAILVEVRKAVPEDAFIEQKKSSEGRVIGFCVDWTSVGISEDLPDVVTSLIRDKGAYADYSPQNTYLDAYATQPDKGAALIELKKILGVKGNVAYLGDSPFDNAAFEKSDISIGIDHGQPIDVLRCDYLIRYELVGRFLGLLLEKNLELSAGDIQSLGGARKSC